MIVRRSRNLTFRALCIVQNTTSRSRLSCHEPRLARYLSAKIRESESEPSKPQTESPASFSVPWYATTGATARTMDTSLPLLPENSPKGLEELTKFLVLDLGLENVQVFDLRNRENIGSYDAKVAVVCTGKSPKHISRAAPSLLLWSKQETGVAAGRDGILSPKILLRDRRRTERKLERQRYAAHSVNQFAQAGPVAKRIGDWVAIDVKISGICVHIFTAERRAQVDLDSLFQAPVEEDDDISLEDFRKSYGLPRTADNSPSIIKKGIRSLHTSALPQSKTPAFSIEDCQKQLENLQLKLARGEVPSYNERVDFMLHLAYTGLEPFQKLNMTPQSRSEWNSLCGRKIDLFKKFHALVYQSAGREIRLEREPLSLLYRALVSPSATTILPEVAMADLEPVTHSSAFADCHEPAVRQLLMNTPFLYEPEVFMTMMTVLANNRRWRELYHTLSYLLLRACLPSSYLKAITGTIVKTGDIKAIDHMLNYVLRAQFANETFELDKDFKAILQAGLNKIGAGKSHPNWLTELLDVPLS